MNPTERAIIRHHIKDLKAIKENASGSFHKQRLSAIIKKTEQKLIVESRENNNVLS